MDDGLGPESLSSVMHKQIKTVMINRLVAIVRLKTEMSLTESVSEICVRPIEKPAHFLIQHIPNVATFAHAFPESQYRCENNIISICSTLTFQFCISVRTFLHFMISRYTAYV